MVWVGTLDQLHDLQHFIIAGYDLVKLVNKVYDAFLSLDFICNAEIQVWTEKHINIILAKETFEVLNAWVGTVVAVSLNHQLPFSWGIGFIPYFGPWRRRRVLLSVLIQGVNEKVIGFHGLGRLLSIFWINLRVEIVLLYFVGVLIHPKNKVVRHLVLVSEVEKTDRPTFVTFKDLVQLEILSFSLTTPLIIPRHATIQVKFVKELISCDVMQLILLDFRLMSLYLCNDRISFPCSYLLDFRSSDSISGHVCYLEQHIRIL